MDFFFFCCHSAFITGQSDGLVEMVSFLRKLIIVMYTMITSKQERMLNRVQDSKTKS